MAITQNKNQFIIKCGGILWKTVKLEKGEGKLHTVKNNPAQKYPCFLQLQAKETPCGQQQGHNLTPEAPVEQRNETPNHGTFLPL